MADDLEPVHSTWLHSDQYIPAHFMRPARRFMQVEAAGGVVLLIAAVVAVIWANSPGGASYFEFWGSTLSFEFGPIHVEETYKDIVNDGLMAIFFFVVGLEIKRELVIGELSEPRKAALPALAAVGGMAVPALIYLAFVLPSGGEAVNGWGIPMATDIAFAIGLVAILGSRISSGAKLFLLALAIVDDIGAIVVIAVVYTEDLSLWWLAFALGAFAAIWLGKRAGIRAGAFYVPLAILVWFGFLESGVHATIAGVILGLLTPARALYSDTAFHQRATWIMERWDMNRRAPDAAARLDHDALELAAVARESVSPLRRMERALHNWSSFLIVPLFALANAGVRFVDIDMVSAVLSPVALGVSAGLVIGKPIGIGLATWIALRLNLGRLPARTSFKTITGLGLLAGVGFTVSLFITELAFTSEILTDEAKIGIFLGSGVAGVAGFLLLRSMKTPEQEIEEARERMAPSGGD